jgi:hypothetical protein
MCSVFGVVEPLSSILAAICFTVDVFNSKCVSGIDVDNCGTILVDAELKLAKLLSTVLIRCCVEPCSVISEPIAVFESEGIAFTYRRISLDLLCS